jgi:hypothetical protein
MSLGSGIRDPGSEIRDPEKPIPDPGSRGQKGTGSRIRNTAGKKLRTSVADPYPKDPYDFGPPGSGSGSNSTRYGFGSGSFYNDIGNQAKIIGKTFIPTVL